MNIQLPQKLILRLTLFLLLLSSARSYGQCNLYAWSGTYWGTYNGAGWSLVGGTWYSPATYFGMAMLSGGSYGISTCASGLDAEITGWNNANNTILFYNDGYGPICGPNWSPASVDNYVPNFTSYAWIQVSEYQCRITGPYTSSTLVEIRQNNNLVFTSSNAAMCSGQTRNLTATPAPLGSVPDGNFGNPGTFSGTGVSGNVFTAPVVGAPTNYTITYTFGFVSQTQVITVNPRPTIGVSTIDGTICIGDQTRLNGSGAASYAWTGGVTDNVNFSPAATATYTCVGTSALGCTSSNSPTIAIVVNPLPTIGSTTTNSVICIGANTSLSGTGGNTYTWTGGVTNGASFSPASTATYVVTGTLASTGCTNTAQRTITVNPLPTIGSTTTNSVICLGASTSLSGTGGNTYTWTGGVTNGASFSPVSTATYIVTGTLASTGCTNTAQRTITVNPLPTIGSTTTNSVICFGDQTSLSGTGGNTYTWTGGVTNGVNFSPAATATYVVTGTLASTGCTNTAQRTITVNPLPPVGSTTTNSVICFGQGTSLSGTGATTYTWSGGVTNAVTFTPVTTATYVVTGTLASTGCTNTAQRTITVNPLPIVGSTTTNSVICFGQNTTLNGTGATTYTWTGGVTNGVSFTPAATQTYVCNGTDGAGCTSTNSAQRTITVNPLPVVGSTTTNSVICFGQSSTLNGTGAISYTWTGGSVTNGIPFTPASTITYTVNGTDAAGCTSTNSAQRTITVNPLPVVTANTSTTQVCLGFPVTLTGGNADTYTWTSGAINGVPTVPVVTTTYNVAGTNTLTGCTSTNNAFQTVTVHARPTVGATVTNSVICLNGTTTFNGTGANTYTWITGPTNGVPYSPPASGSFTVTGTSTAGCTSTNVAFTSVTVNPLPPVAAGTSSAAICFGFNTNLTATGALTYTWNPGGATGTPNNVTPSGTTVYTVTGTDGNGCENTATQTITIYPLPVVTATASKPVICINATTSLLGGGADTYTWNPAIPNNTSFSPVNTATYQVTGTHTLTGCVSTNVAVQTITVNPLPVVSASTTNSVICFGFSSTLNGSGASTYTWNPGNLNGSPVVTPATTTQYTVFGTDVNGCTSTNVAVQGVTVNSLPPVAAGTSSAAICFGFNTNLTATGALTYTWSPGGATGTPNNVTPSGTTVYTVTGTDGNGCENTATQTITIYPLPVVTATASKPVICINATTSLLGGGADTYTWNPAIPNNTSFSPVNTQTYQVTGTHTLTGCVSTNVAVQTITVNPLPVVSASTTNSVICFGFSSTLNGSGASTYTWNPGNLNGSPVVTPATTTQYTVFGTDVNGCTSTNVAVQGVTVNSLPPVAAGTSSAAICFGFNTNLTATGALTYTWSPGGATGTPNNVTPSGTTVYTVTGTDGNGCENTATQTITIYPLPVVTATASKPVICINATTSLLGGGADTYTWNPAIPNNTSFSPINTATYQVAGTNTLTGCVSTNVAVQTITVNPLPVVTATVSNPVICFGFSTTLTGAGASTYTWNPGGIVGSPVVVSPATNSVYSLAGTDVNGCTSTNVAVQGVTVNALPPVAAGTSSAAICFGFNTNLTATGALTYTWNPGGATGTPNNVTPSGTTVYTVTGTDGNGCENTATQTITIYPLPVVTATASKPVICINATTSLLGGGADTYTWSPAIPNNTSFSPVNTLTYQVTGTNTLTGCVSTNVAVQTITVNPLPIVSASASNSVICFGYSTTLTGSGASTYTWNPGGIVGSPTIVSPATNSVYSLAGTDVNGCTSTNVATQGVTVNASPILVTAPNASICIGSAATLSVTGGDTYTWNPGPLTGSIQSVSPVATTAYTVTGTNTLTGCTNTMVQNITVNLLPVVSANVTNSVICFGQTSTITASGASTYTWNPGPTIASSIVVTPNSTIDYSVVGTSTAGCVSSNTAVTTITVNALPSVTATAANTVFCFGGSTTLTATGANTYTWNPGGPGTVITVTPGITTNYTLMGTSLAGCTNTNIAISTVSVNPLPVVGVSSPTPGVCQGFSTAIIATNADTYTWTPGPLNGATVNVTPALTTTYTVIGTNTLTGCTSTNVAAQTITVDALPTVTASISSSVICAGVSTTLSATGANTYTWNPGPLTGSAVSVSPGTTTDYTLVGKSAVGCLSTNTLVLTVTVNPLPVLASTVTNSVICDGAATTLSATGADTYTWSGGIGITNGVPFNPTITATYSVSGTNTLTGCSSFNTSSKSVTVNPLPVVTLSSSSPTMCAGFSVTLSAGNAGTYTWTPGGPNLGTITVSPATSTVYSVVGTNPLTGCTSTNVVTQSITVHQLPVVGSAISNSVICAGDLITLTGSGASTYTWSGGAPNGTPFAPTTTTVYTLAGTSTAGCTSTNSASQSVTVNTLPNVTANTTNTSVCLGSSVTLTGGGANTYTWTNSVVDNVAFAPANTATYNVTGTDANSCKNTASVVVVVDAIPTVSASSTSSMVCFGGSITLTGSGANTYTWTGGVTDGVSFAPATTGTFGLTGSSPVGCVSSNTAVISITVNPLPVVTATITKPVICSGFTTSVFSGGANTYNWSDGLVDGIAFSPAASAVYTLTGTDLNNCQNTTTVSVTVNALPVVAISSNNSILCEGNTATITASGANTYTWNTLQNTAVIVVNPTVTTSYSVTGVDVNGCVNTNSFVQTVSVCPGIFTATATYTNVSCFGKTDGRIEIASTISYTNYSVSYNWSPASVCPGNNCSTISNLAPGSYSVAVRLTYTLNNTLVKTDSILFAPMNIIAELPACETQVYTGITPNNDGTNDVMTIDNITQYPNNRVTIFTRWGDMLYDTKGYNNTSIAWPSPEEANKLTSGTYFYIIELGDGSKPRKGWIEVMKH